MPGPASPAASQPIAFDFRLSLSQGQHVPSSLVHVADDPFLGGKYVDTAEVEETFDPSPAAQAQAADAQAEHDDDCFRNGVSQGGDDERDRMVHAIYDNLAPDLQAKYRTAFGLPQIAGAGAFGP